MSTQDGKQKSLFDWKWKEELSPSTSLYPVKSSPMEQDGQAKRDNAGKTPYAYLPLDLLDGASRVMAFGASKYGLNNFRKGYEDLKSPLNSILRHAVAVQHAILVTDEKPDELELFMRDAESGESHIDHLITSCLLLKQAIKVKQEKGEM
jgi:Domain of unknown function (DUF5664)